MSDRLLRVLTRLNATGMSWRPAHLTKAEERHLDTLITVPRLQAVDSAVRGLLAGRGPLALGDAWRDLDGWLQRQGRSLTLLFDDLDVALGESAAAIAGRRAMLIGLLDQANAAWFSGRQLGVKIFLRSDLFNQLGADEQAKYRERGFELAWRPDDLWRLVIRAMAVADTASGRRSASSTGNARGNAA